MPLNDLSLEELTDLSRKLADLAHAGGVLAAVQLRPTFNLTPGQNATISLPFQMPDAPGRATKEDVARIEAKLDQRLAQADGIPDWAIKPPSTEAAPDAPGAVATDAPKASEPVPAQAGTIPSAPEQSVAGQPEPIPPVAAPQTDPLPVTRAAEESGGGQDDQQQPAPAPEPGAQPPAAPIPGSASALAATTAPKLWTHEEEARLVNLVATAIVNLGLPKKTAIIEAARILGRPEQATQFRVYHKLKARIDAAISTLAMDQAQTETPDAGEPPTPSPEAARQDESPAAEVLAEASVPLEGEPPAPEPEPGAGGHDQDLDAKSRAAAIAHGNGPEGEPVKAWHRPEHIADEVTAHLMTLPEKGGWTVDRDLELMDLSIQGWQPNEIALELKVQANQVKPRFDALTGLYEDAAGKKVRRFTRDEVFAALTRLAGKAA